MSEIEITVEQLGELIAQAKSGRVNRENLQAYLRNPFIAAGISGLFINCDANPFVPDGWRVEEHRKGGQLEWDPKKVKLHLSKNQQAGNSIEGNKLRRELADQPVLNANVLDYLLVHPYLIPEEWKGLEIYYWGTIYRRFDDDLCVRYLFCGGGVCYWGYHCLGSDWGGGPAALLAS